MQEGWLLKCGCLEHTVSTLKCLHACLNMVSSIRFDRGWTRTMKTEDSENISISPIIPFCSQINVVYSAPKEHSPGTDSYPYLSDIWFCSYKQPGSCQSFSWREKKMFLHFILFFHTKSSLLNTLHFELFSLSVFEQSLWTQRIPFSFLNYKPRKRGKGHLFKKHAIHSLDFLSFSAIDSIGWNWMVSHVA